MEVKPPFGPEKVRYTKLHKGENFRPTLTRRCSTLAQPIELISRIPLAQKVAFRMRLCTELKIDLRKSYLEKFLLASIRNVKI